MLVHVTKLPKSLSATVAREHTSFVEIIHVALKRARCRKRLLADFAIVSFVVFGSLIIVRDCAFESSGFGSFGGV